MKVSVFGLGYVGCVTAACLARRGHFVLGVDVNPEKTDMLRAGHSPIVEPGLPELLQEQVASGRLQATTDTAEAIRTTDVTLISVGTPSRSDGSIELSHVYQVCEQIGVALRDKTTQHTVIIRSTVLPGTTHECAEILRQAARDESGRIAVCFNPEFLREGAAIKDFDLPPFTVIGADDDSVTDVVKELYRDVDAPVISVAIRVAEMVKYTCNAFHALKVAFANEIGRLAQAHGVDGREVMNIIVQDTQLNISPAYLRPGFAYGGSCLPKDVAALLQSARTVGATLPLLSSLSATNTEHLDHAFRLISTTGKRKVAVLGLAFKGGTDDLRSSPSVALVKRLIGEGYDVQVYDPAVQTTRLIGANRQYIESTIPHIGRIMVEDPSRIIEEADVIVVANGTNEFRELLAQVPAGRIVVDLVGLVNHEVTGVEYRGSAW